MPAPLPFNSPPWVNAYVIESGEGFLMIDCGTDWEPGREALMRGFAELGLDPAAVHTLVVSHLHPDHVGMASRLVREWGWRFVMHSSAARLVPEYNDTPGYYRRIERIGKAHGAPEAMIAAATSAPRPSYMPLLDPPDHTVDDGDVIDLGGGRRLEVLHTPGHDRAHICLLDNRARVFFSGDHVLPRISPVVMYDGESDVLGEYLDSLRRLVVMGIGITYPAHGTLIDHGGERARQIMLHHDRRLLDMAGLVREGRATAWEVMLRSFRPNLDAIESRLALLETISHLDHLRALGRIREDPVEGRVFYRV
ncbi:MAG: MBL fold metallo-hydrolase [Actinobacteria bacterium]|nr:MBL fold metallo-hydrolase [Actinomycetota bacterium]